MPCNVSGSMWDLEIDANLALKAKRKEVQKS